MYYVCFCDQGFVRNRPGINQDLSECARCVFVVYEFPKFQGSIQSSQVQRALTFGVQVSLEHLLFAVLTFQSRKATEGERIVGVGCGCWFVP